MLVNVSKRRHHLKNFPAASLWWLKLNFSLEALQSPAHTSTLRQATNSELPLETGKSFPKKKTLEDFFMFPSSFGRAKLRRLSWEEYFHSEKPKRVFLVPPHKRPNSQCSPSHLSEKVLIENLFRALLDIDFKIPFIVSASSLLEIENSPSELLFFCLSFRRD